MAKNCGSNHHIQGLNGTEEVICTTQIQVKAGIIWIVWICEGKDVIINIEVQHHNPIWTSR